MIRFLPLLFVLAACSQPDLRRDESTEAPVPAASYERAEGAVYRVDPSRSLILVKVGRDGPAARLGHDHAIASESVEGFIEINRDPNRSRADLAFPLRELTVDKAAYRERLSLKTEPSESDIAGTYANMLKVLSPEAHPWATINATVAEPGKLAVAVTLAGRASNYLVPFRIESDDTRVTVTGDASIRHSDFGLEPYSAAGGLLRVADTLELSFEIVGARVTPSTASP